LIVTLLLRLEILGVLSVAHAKRNLQEGPAPILPQGVGRPGERPRFADETPGISASESALAPAAACALGGPLSKLAAETLRQLVPSTFARDGAD
jgi:hypothetical protein